MMNDFTQTPTHEGSSLYLPKIALENPDIWPVPLKEGEPKESSWDFISVSVGWNYRRKDRECIGFQWGARKFGFGEISFGRWLKPEAKGWTCDSECMSSTFVRAVLEHFLATGPKTRRANNLRWNKRRMDPKKMARYFLDNLATFEIDERLDQLYKKRGWL
jgi:hypothetical protein